ncbi:uncharacterized protein UTRI_04366_B [Ustilago trichophora]|uniref:Zn(2)-C6 fungal-type domain-containing protein n=1 Tax=Ustilago trichophora TaxID=86804 RepID=A0A5C3ED90_9BASI|nr:uncharacterized protein UTRI_04366_B [Ustilago trichophora]
MSSSPHPSRSAAHQLQHPEHASYSPSPRSTPLYSSTARKSHVYRGTPDASSPEAFNEYDRSKRTSRDHHSPAASLAATASRISSAPSDPSQPQTGPSAPKRRKQSHHSPSHPTSSSSPSLTNSKPASTEMPVADSTMLDSKPSTRVAKACQPCSTKKRRCDGRQPECSVCQVLGTPCTYNHTGLKRGPPKGFRSGPKESARAKLIRTLETTIRDLVNHLGKEDARAEIVRVSGERELPIAESHPAHESHRRGLKSESRPGSRVDTDGRSSSRIKIEHLTSCHPSTSYNHTRDSGGDEDERAAEAEEDVIGETRQGELVYRGSSSGIGILQRQHRAESPSGPIGMAANRSVTSNSSAPFAARSRDERGIADVAQHGKAPVFLPISSPRPIGDADTASSQDRSPRPSKLTPRREASNLQSLYPGSKSDGQASAQHVSTEDPVVSDEETDRLFRYYWQGFHPFYPILYKPWFVGFSREELRANLEPSLLYAIYAIGACVVPGNASSTSTTKPESSLQKLNLERAQSFCEAAERHALAKGLRPDIASIQTCWLLSLYSHGTGDLSRAWNFQNLASSMAVDMGLHRWPIYRPEIVQDRVQRETRIRIIWHCYIVDKLLCAEMGRPVGLRAKDIDVPLLSETEDDEFELWSDQTEMQPAEQAGARPSTATSASARRLHAPSCLNWGVHLFKIVERILDEVHSLRRKALLRRQGKEQVLTDLDRQLTDWKDKLPPHLHLDDSNNDGPFPSFFALNLWYYTARLLLHRPFIPQEEGLAMSKVLENDSHRQSTLAANTICDLLEATSSRDIVDRLSTDLGYCLFTAAVMFVFNARLPDAKIASDARRRYGLCMQWLKKLADTWPAASAHRMLLDGFAVVGEDASKQGADPQRRRPSIAALHAANAGTGIGATSKVSSWIAETEGALQELAPADMGGRNAAESHARVDPQRGHSQQGSAPRTANQQGGVPDGDPDLQHLSDPWAPKSNNGFSTDAGNNNHFAPGIFDVESFFWNENAAAPQLMMGMNFTPLPASNSMASAMSQHQSMAANPQNIAFNSGFNGGMLSNTFAPMNTMQGGAQPASMQYSTGGVGYNQQQQPHQQQQQRQMQSAAPAPRSVTNVAQPGMVAVSQAPTSGPDPSAVGNFNTSPFAFNPTNQSIGEFWSMLELPPAFLQQ